MEAQRENRPDFWLLQYQKLMDQQPAELSLQTAAIDPLLGFQFLSHGVVHCLPFLSKIWQDSQTELQDISNDQLLAAGVQNDADRFNILRSIEIYLQVIRGEEAVTVDASQAEEEATAPSDEMEQQQLVTGQIVSSECVICMDAEVNPLPDLISNSTQTKTFKFPGKSSLLSLWPSLLLCQLSNNVGRVSNVSWHHRTPYQNYPSLNYL